MSRFVMSVLAVAVAAVIGISGAFAAEGKGKDGKRPPMDPEQAFKKLDTNSDGFLSMEEWSKGPFAQRMDESKRKEVFGKIDSNGDGKISLEEMKAAFEKMKEHHEKGGKGGKGGKKGDK